MRMHPGPGGSSPPSDTTRIPTLLRMLYIVVRADGDFGPDFCFSGLEGDLEVRGSGPRQRMVPLLNGSGRMLRWYVVTSVPFLQLGQFWVGQVPTGELTGRLQQSVARARAGAIFERNCAAGHQARQQRHNIATWQFIAARDRCRGLQIEGGRENTDSHEQRPLGVCQQVVAPCHRCRQAAMAGIGSTGCGIKHLEPVAEQCGEVMQ